MPLARFGLAPGYVFALESISLLRLKTRVLARVLLTETDCHSVGPMALRAQKAAKGSLSGAKVSGLKSPGAGREGGAFHLN
jgi:hypothetical protein